MNLSVHQLGTVPIINQQIMDMGYTHPEVSINLKKTILGLNHLFGPLHFYDCKFKERTSNT